MLDFCFIRLNGKFIKVPFDDILYVEAHKNYPRIFLRHDSFIALITMKQLEHCLPAGLFCRIHRSYIISLKQISAFNSRHLFIGEKMLPIARHYQKGLYERLLIIDGENVTAPPHTISIASAIVGKDS